MEKDIKSPCIKVCKYDDDRVCVGCYRTMNEITRWPFMTDQQKTDSLKDAALRKITPKTEINDYDYYV
jgi:predicted Fe-S protein YdhL (DUF1289 family)